MDEFKVDKIELLDNLKRNRDKHLEEYQTAMIGWKEAVVKKMAAELKRLEGTDEEPDLNFLSDLPKPVSYEKSYTEAMEVLEWENESLVVLNWQQMSQWARDEWGWSKTFLRTNAGYTQMS